IACDCACKPCEIVDFHACSVAIVLQSTVTTRPNRAIVGNHRRSFPLVHFQRAKQAFLRLLMAYAVFLAAVQFFRLLLLPAIQYVFHPGDAVTSLVRRAGIVLFAVLGYWAYVRFVEKRKVSE